MRLLILTLPLLLASGLAQAQSSTVYQWKDSNGVTQYSERPPVGRQADMRRIGHRGAVSQEVAPAATLPPACVNARKNAELLAGTGPIGRDTDGDGVPDTALTADERAAEKARAEADVANYCPGNG